MGPISICFATPGVLPFLVDSAAVYGGSELRAVRFMRGLASRSEWRVSVVVFAASAQQGIQPDIEIISDNYALGHRSLLDRLCELPPFKPRNGAGPVVHRGEARAWRRANASIYIAFGVSDYAAKLTAWCRRNQRKVVLAAGSDSDFDLQYQLNNSGLNAYGSRNSLCRYAIDMADSFICQTKNQAQLLATRFNRESVVVRNPVELCDPLPGLRRHALWLGKTDDVKRPALFCELARMCPEVPCVLIANVTDRARYQSLLETAPSNLIVRESVPRQDLDRLLADSFCLVNTSVFEGFPNAFLDAGRQAVPVLSLNVDPDGVIEESGGGVVAKGDLASLAASVRGLCASQERSKRMGLRWRRYVESNHAIERKISEFSTAMSRFATESRRPAPPNLGD